MYTHLCFFSYLLRYCTVFKLLHNLEIINFVRDPCYETRGNFHPGASRGAARGAAARGDSAPDTAEMQLQEAEGCICCQ